MLAIRNGDEEAFKVLMGRHVDALYRYALRLSHSPALADDLTQDTWLTVWEKTSRFKNHCCCVHHFPTDCREVLCVAFVGRGVFFICVSVAVRAWPLDPVHS